MDIAVHMGNTKPAGVLKGILNQLKYLAPYLNTQFKFQFLGNRNSARNLESLSAS